jgi:hypothetical protein
LRPPGAAAAARVNPLPTFRHAPWCARLQRPVRIVLGFRIARFQQRPYAPDFLAEQLVDREEGSEELVFGFSLHLRRISKS